MITVMYDNKSLVTQEAKTPVVLKTYKKYCVSDIRINHQDYFNQRSMETIFERGKYLFKHTSDFYNLVVPDGVASIAEGMFQNGGVHSAKFPEGLYSIGARAFENNRQLNSIELPTTLKSIGDYCFYQSPLKGDLVLPDSVTEIGAYAFSMTSLTSAVIPNGIIELSEGIFAGDVNNFHPRLTSCTLPDGLKVIGERAFQACNNLTELNLPDSVTELRNFALWYCDSLTLSSLPSNLVSIGRCALSGPKFSSTLVFPLN